MTLEPIERHRYSKFVVRLSSLLYTHVGCRLRSIIEILEIVNETFNEISGETPTYNSIGNWVKKCGLGVENQKYYSIHSFYSGIYKITEIKQNSEFLHQRAIRTNVYQRYSS